MNTAIPLTVAALISAAVIFIGSSYLIAPQGISRSFGLKPPAPDADTRAWLRLKGIRDVSSGLVVLALMIFAGRHAAGIAFLAFSVVALGDMSIVLGSGGSRSAAFSIHGATFAVMLVVGFLMLHAA